LASADSRKRLVRGNLRLIDRKTKQETTFADADAVVDAGWAID
jgi:hypothetical protein